MTSGNGIQAFKALAILADSFGYPRDKLAAHLGAHPRTARRWETGQHQPCRRYRTALRALVGELIMVELAGENTTRTEIRRHQLDRAALALMTTAEKQAAQVERDEIAARLRADLDAAEQQGQVAERDADVRQWAAEHRQARRDRIAAAIAAADGREPVRSVTTQADVFAVIDSGRPAEVPMFGAVAV